MSWEVVSKGNLSDNSAWEIWPYLPRNLPQLPRGLWWRSPVRCFQEGAQLLVFRGSHSNQRNTSETRGSSVSSPRPVSLSAEMLLVHDPCDDRSVIGTGLTKHGGKQRTHFAPDTERRVAMILRHFQAQLYTFAAYTYLHIYKTNWPRTEGFYSTLQDWRVPSSLVFSFKFSWKISKFWYE